jgi:hypothetical protein
VFSALKGGGLGVERWDLVVLGGGNVYMVGMDEVDMMSVGWDVLEGKSTEGGI